MDFEELAKLREITETKFRDLGETKVLNSSGKPSQATLLVDRPIWGVYRLI